MAVSRSGLRRQAIFVVFGFSFLWFSLYSYFYFRYSTVSSRNKSKSWKPEQYLRPLVNITYGRDALVHEAIDKISLAESDRSRKRF